MSLANSKRKQDEKNLKILRDLASQSPNRICFDCKQKGPTYINTTIGSFVCTSCSGLLRGLNPPHRVKSISMASFTNEEIELLKSKGNEYCKSVWMAHYNENTNYFPESKDAQNFLEFMISKYEKKRFYAEPDTALKNIESNDKKIMPLETKSIRSNGKIEPSKSAFKLPGPNSSTSPINLNKPRINVNGLLSNSIGRSSSLGFLSEATTTSAQNTEWDNAFEPFIAPFKNNFSKNENFANFDKANIFVSSQTSTVKSTSVPFSLSSNPLTPISSSLNVLSSINVPGIIAVNSKATEDRYAALKDLDEAFKFKKEVTKENKSTDSNCNQKTSGSAEQHFMQSTAGGWANFDMKNFQSKETASTNPWASASSNPFVSPQSPPTSQPSYNPFL